MDLFANIDPTLKEWVLIPLLIFFARIMDVSIGTLRIVFVSRGDKKIAPLLGFVETLIWLVAVGQILNNVSNVAGYLAFGAGYATGNYIGLLLEERLAMGQVVIRTIMSMPAEKLTEILREEGYRVTCIDAQGRDGKTQIIFMIVPRKKVQHVIDLILEYNPRAFYSIENIRSVSDDPTVSSATDEDNGWRKFFPLRKAK